MKRFLEYSAVTALGGAALPILVDSTAKGAVLLLVAAAVTTILRRASASARHVAWVLAIIGMLLLPVLSAGLPGWRVLPSWIEPPPLASVESVAPLPPTADSSFSPSGASGTRSGNDVPHATPTHDSVASLSAALPSRAAEPNESLSEASHRSARSDPLWTALVLVWLIGAIVIAGRVIVSHIVLLRLSRASVPVTQSNTKRLLAELCRELGIRRTVTLLRTSRRSMPMAWGVLRSCVLLPADSEDWTDDRLRAVLLHELAHIRRHDPLIQLLVQTTCALYWFNPLLWFAAWRIRVERERACDDVVLNTGMSPFDYAEHLLRVATGRHGYHLASASAVAMASSSRLEGRLLSVVNVALNRRRLTVRTSLFAVILALVVVLPVAMMQAATDNDSSAKEEGARQETDLEDTETKEGPDDDANATLPPTLRHIAELIPLTTTEADALAELAAHGRLQDFDPRIARFVDLDDTLPDLSAMAGLTKSELQALSETLSQHPFKTIEALLARRDAEEASTEEKAAIAKLAHLHERQRANHRCLAQIQQDADLTDAQNALLTKLTQYLHRRRLSSILTVRQRFEPGPKGRSSWSQLFAQTGSDGSQFHMALMRGAVGGIIPAQIGGSEETLFNICVIEGDDAELAVLIAPAGDKTPDPAKDSEFLALVRDQPVEFEVNGKVYSLVFASSWLARASPDHVSPMARLILTFEPDKAVAQRTIHGTTPPPDAEQRGLTWGPEVQGLQAAHELVPRQQAYAYGDAPQVRFHIRNVSPQLIRFHRLGAKNSDRGVVRDEDGRKVPVEERHLGGDVRPEQYVLRPGEAVVVDGGSFGVAKKGTGEDLGRFTLICQPGAHQLSFQLRLIDFNRNFTGGETPPSDDVWLPTGATPLLVTDKRNDLSENSAKPAPQRHFVRIVVGHERLTFEGVETTWQDLNALLQAVDNRASTVLEFAVSSDDFTIKQVAELQARAGPLARQLGFEYASYIGVHRLGSKGTPSQRPRLKEDHDRDQKRRSRAAHAHELTRLAEELKANVYRTPDERSRLEDIFWELAEELGAQDPDTAPFEFQILFGELRLLQRMATEHKQREQQLLQKVKENARQWRGGDAPIESQILLGELRVLQRMRVRYGEREQQLKQYLKEYAHQWRGDAANGGEGEPR